MADGSDFLGNSELEESPRVLLRLCKQVRLESVGKVSGESYCWSGAGAEVWVDERDAPHLLSRNRVSCCSGLPVSPYFEIVT